jgi:hypothetical protein
VARTRARREGGVVSRISGGARSPAFAGEDIAVAKYLPQDREYLLEFEPTVVHYEVVGGGSSVDPGTGS